MDYRAVFAFCCTATAVFSQGIVQRIASCWNSKKSSCNAIDMYTVFLAIIPVLIACISFASQLDPAGAKLASCKIIVGTQNSCL